MEPAAKLAMIEGFIPFANCVSADGLDQIERRGTGDGNGEAPNHVAARHGDGVPTQQDLRSAGRSGESVRRIERRFCRGRDAALPGLCGCAAGARCNDGVIVSRVFGSTVSSVYAVAEPSTTATCDQLFRQQALRRMRYLSTAAPLVGVRADHSTITSPRVSSINRGLPIMGPGTLSGRLTVIFATSERGPRPALL